MKLLLILTLIVLKFYQIICKVKEKYLLRHHVAETVYSIMDNILDPVATYICLSVGLVSEASQLTHY